MSEKEKIIRSCLMQHDSSDCGVACLVSVIRYLGGDAELEKIRLMSGTGQSGTSMLGLYQAASELGLDATGYEASVSSIIEYADVLILHVRKEEYLEHFIIVFSYEKGLFKVWDPSVGFLALTSEELDKIWVSRKCLGLKPNSKFRLKKREGRKKLKWILKVIAPERDFLIVSFLIGIIVSVLGLVLAVYTQKLIDQVLPAKKINYLVITGFLVLILLVTRVILAAIRQALLLNQGKLLNIRVVHRFFSSLFPLPKIFFDTRKTGDFVARLNDTMRLQKVIADVMGSYLIDILVVAVSLVSIFVYSFEAGLVTLLFFPLFYLGIARLSSRLISCQTLMMQGYAANESNFIDTLKGIMEIRSHNWNDFYINKSNSIYSGFQERILDLGKLKIRLSLNIGVIGSFYIVLVLILASVGVIKSDLTQGELMAIVGLCSNLLPSAINLFLINIPVSEAKVAVNRMFEFMSDEPEDDIRVPPVPDLRIGRLTMEGISFRYPGQRLLLERVSLDIRKGEIVVLVGENGSGKSTLANLLLRFYTPETGSIYVDGERDTDSLTIQQWRKSVGYIPQEIHIFNGTILQNLIIDPSESSIKDALSAIDAYGLHDSIQSFPNGILTIVGEEGINLSGGQKQVIAYIREIIRKPDILVIDEGTSNMDFRTELLIMEILQKLKREMGILVITHRLDFARKISDSINVLCNRTIEFRGDHNTLMSSDNFYRQYWNNYR
jgi:ATP-binding cassette, subfamily C, bacteriocin exporter